MAYDQQSISVRASGGGGIEQDEGSNIWDGEVRVSSEGSRENKVVRMFRMGVGGYYDSEELIA